MKPVDIIDKRLLLELDVNCRVSFEELSRKLNITSNAVKKRFDKLAESGVIDEFTVAFKPAMTGAEYLIAEVRTDGSEDEEELINLIGENDMTVQAGLLAGGEGRSYMVHAEYIGTDGLLELGRFLRGLEGVQSVDLHTMVTDPGRKTNLTNLHLRVLRHLIDDPRMTVSEIANRSGLTARRVRKLLTELIESRSFWFSVRWNLSAGPSTEFYVRLEYDQSERTPGDIDQWLRSEYEMEYWYSYVSAMEPVLFAKFVTDHFRDAEKITRNMTAADFTKSTRVLICYPVRKFARLGQTKLQEMLAEAGLWP
ncbi:MAG: winged helix-turn-helix transcriptional regulator [Candidatus Thorarchaeota archaeon]|nr:MAG: winged helix-turn-helix transcriptional regulator [Candidatus Thorarchaeota archaeon]